MRVWEIFIEDFGSSISCVTGQRLYITGLDTSTEVKEWYIKENPNALPNLVSVRPLNVIVVSKVSQVTESDTNDTNNVKQSEVET